MPKISAYSTASALEAGDKALIERAGSYRSIDAALLGGSGASEVFAPVTAWRMHSNLTLPITGAVWTDLDTEGNVQVRPFDLVVPEVEIGDLIQIFPDINVGSASGGFLMTAYVVKNGTYVRNLFEPNYGPLNWSAQTGQNAYITFPAPPFTIQAADIEAGTVRLRLRHQTSTAARTMNGSAGFNSSWTARHYRPHSGLKFVFDGQSFNYAPLDGSRPLSLSIADEFAGVANSVHGISGTTYATRSTTAATRSHPNFVGWESSVLIDTGGQSDLLAGSSAATILSNMQSYHTAAKAAGADYSVIATVPPMITGATWGYTAGMETVRLALNTSIRNAVGPWDAVADIAASTNATATGNTTYYPDGLHPSATLVDEWVPIYTAAITAALS